MAGLRVRGNRDADEADFDVLDDMSNEELEVLTQIIIDKGGFTNGLTDNVYYKEYAPDHRQYTLIIAREIRQYGSNSFGGMRTYKEILCDVCDKLDVPYNSRRNVEEIENNLLETVLEKAWNNMSDSERKELIGEIDKKNVPVGSSSASVLIAAFKAGGFESYKLAVIIANYVAQIVLGHGLTLATNATLTRLLGILTGPIGIALTAGVTIFNLAGAAYRVTVPAVVYIAAMRSVKKHSRPSGFFGRLFG